MNSEQTITIYSAICVFNKNYYRNPNIIIYLIPIMFTIVTSRLYTEIGKYEFIEQLNRVIHNNLPELNKYSKES